MSPAGFYSFCLLVGLAFVMVAGLLYKVDEPRKPTPTEDPTNTWRQP